MKTPAEQYHSGLASRIGAKIQVELVPVHPVVRNNFGDKSLEMALSGGEDYELLFTASNDIIERVTKAVNCPITVIGEVTADKMGRVILVDKQGKPYKPVRTGWQHFTNTAKI